MRPPAQGAARRFAQSYRAPAWLPDGHSQTIWAAKVARHHAHIGTHAPVRWQRERWATPDGDFVDVDHAWPAQAPAPRSKAPQAAPDVGAHLVLFHGLEGSSASAYAQAFAHVAAARGWAMSVPHFRGCSGELNLAPRAYHCGDFAEVGWMLQRLRQASAAPLSVVGVSLGGNAVLRWAQEAGSTASATVHAIAAVCAPIDMTSAGRAVDQGLNRLLYARMFPGSMKPRAAAKWHQHPGLFDLPRVQAARTLREFDDAFTAPLHGFAGVEDYYTRASAKPRLSDIRLPALLLHARNDPFVPAGSLPMQVPGDWVQLWQPAQGGHVGFPAGGFPAHVSAMPGAVCDWLCRPG